MVPGCYGTAGSEGGLSFFPTSAKHQIIFIPLTTASRYDTIAYRCTLHRYGRRQMFDVLSLLPTILLFVMIVLTLVLLPLLEDERSSATERQQTDRIRLPRRPR